MSKRDQQTFRLAAVARRASGLPARSRVWLLEDSPLQAEYLKEALAEFDVVHFLDGVSLLDQFTQSAQSPPAAMILDWELPGISGLEVLRALREVRDEVTLPILVLTSDEHAMLQAHCFGNAFFVHLKWHRQAGVQNFQFMAQHLNFA